MMAQVGTAILLLFSVAGLGGLPSAAIGTRLGLPMSTRAALVPLIGLTGLGIITLLIGHVGFLGPWLPFGTALLGAVITWLGRRDVAQLASGVFRAAVTQARLFPVLVIATASALLLAAVAAAAEPWRVDEVEYHWPSAVDWSSAGRWTDSPFRHVNSFPFMEVIYTAAATHNSYVAAHLLHLTTLVALGLAAAGLARAVGVRGTAAVAAAAIAMPVAWDQAYVAYNDTAVGAFSAGAVAVALGGRATMPSLWTGAGLIAVAVSVKPSAIATAGAIGLMLLLLMATRDARAPQSIVQLLKGWLVVATPAVLALGFWLTREQLITGDWTNPLDSGTPSADALSRLPTDLQQVLSPLLPFVSGIIGAQEPWGGRTSLVVQVFLLPAIVFSVWRGGEVLRRFALVALPAWAHWVVLGLAIVRTRFHIVSWVMLVVAVRVAIEEASNAYPRTQRWLEIIWAAGVLLGLIDVSFEMVRTIRDYLAL